jgi:hypothetical protein
MRISGAPMTPLRLTRDDVREHAYECPCPPIEKWGEVSPYAGD